LNRVFVPFPINDLQATKSKLFNWGNRFEICCFLDNHEYELPHRQLECLLGAGSLASVRASAGTAFADLHSFSEKNPDWLFGHFGFDLKNETERLVSSHPDGIGFPDLFFFVPQIVVELGKDFMRIGSPGSDHQLIFEQIERESDDIDLAGDKISHLEQSFSLSEYLSTVDKLKKHILLGDCYELNFCQSFFAEGIQADPVPWYNQLSRLSPTPFAAFYKLLDKFLLCASPERYLCRRGDLLLSQPMKGTWTRDLSNPDKDRLYRTALQNSAKDRSENVMVVDLVRNDLSKVCKEGSVGVEELFGIYSFPQVHQMMSSVTGKPEPGRSWTEMVRASFPMGSMTGAPKKKVMELIELYEKRKRGLYSGAVGYVTPGRDFDFNVVIRSILYNKSNRYLSFMVGSGITFYSEPEKEYEECMLKAMAIKKVLTG
jgi:para-aminobenzoate synthetase component I